MRLDVINLLYLLPISYGLIFKFDFIDVYKSHYNIILYN